MHHCAGVPLRECVTARARHCNKGEQAQAAVDAMKELGWETPGVKVDAKGKVHIQIDAKKALAKIIGQMEEAEVGMGNVYKEFMYTNIAIAFKPYQLNPLHCRFVNTQYGYECIADLVVRSRSRWRWQIIGIPSEVLPLSMHGTSPRRG